MTPHLSLEAGVVAVQSDEAEPLLEAVRHMVREAVTQHSLETGQGGEQPLPVPGLGHLANENRVLSGLTNERRALLTPAPVRSSGVALARVGRS